jgi:hypothetical protein
VITDAECKAFLQAEIAREKRDDEYAGEMLRARLRCPACGTIWHCRCTIEQAEMAKQRHVARAMADWHRRLRQAEADLKERQRRYDSLHAT